MLTPEQVARASNSKLDLVQKVWGLVLAELKAANMLDRATVVAIAATVAVECHFAIVEERGPSEYFKRYIGLLGNKTFEEALKYKGRGLVQITGLDNYAKYGKLIGVNLVVQPERALEPEVAVKILVAYFKDHGINVHANRGNWLRVRELVNGRRRSAKNRYGKPNGWEEFSNCVYELIEEIYK